MSATLKPLGIDRLSVDERILLAEEIWDSSEDVPNDFPMTEVQKQDLERRLEANRTNPGSGLSWEQVKAKLRARA